MLFFRDINNSLKFAGLVVGFTGGFYDGVWEDDDVLYANKEGITRAEGYYDTTVIVCPD